MQSVQGLREIFPHGSRPKRRASNSLAVFVATTSSGDSGCRSKTSSSRCYIRSSRTHRYQRPIGEGWAGAPGSPFLGSVPITPPAAVRPQLIREATCGERVVVFLNANNSQRQQRNKKKKKKGAGKEKGKNIYIFLREKKTQIKGRKPSENPFPRGAGWEGSGGC